MIEFVTLNGLLDVEAPKGRNKDVTQVIGSDDGPMDAPFNWDRSFLGLGFEKNALNLVPVEVSVPG